MLDIYVYREFQPTVEAFHLGSVVIYDYFRKSSFSFFPYCNRGFVLGFLSCIFSFQ